MTYEDIKKEELRRYRDLAREFLENAARLESDERWRGVVDDAYNSLELGMKAFILAKEDAIPQRHSGVIQKFSEFYIKTEELPRELGPRLRRALRYRNMARYDPIATISKTQAHEVTSLAKELLLLLEKQTSA